MALEVVVFRLQPEVTRIDFLAAIDETTTLLKAQDGFLSRTVSQGEHTSESTPFFLLAFLSAKI